MANSRRIVTSILAVCGVVIVLTFWKLTSRAPSLSAWKAEVHSLHGDSLQCHEIPGANETLLVMRTGATEFIDKIPVHFNTTFLCSPHYMIFSDHDEIYHGHEVLDALSTVSEEIRLNHPDFELHRRLSELGRDALTPDELSGSDVKSDDGGGTSGKASRPGWKLDKWKFLPMLNHTLSLSPGYKWYMFIEPDTIILWSTILKFQEQLDHTKPYYMGAQVNIGDVEFGHGGSGFLVSDTALQQVVEHYVAHQKEWEEFTDGHWAGDAVAGKAFRDAGAGLTRTWPIIQGDHPGAFPLEEDDGKGQPRWCYPSATYHHTSPSDIEDMWSFEQRWIADGGLDRGDGYLRYRDVFTEFIMPQIQTPQSGWDNASEDEQEAADLPGCIELCNANPECLQYRFDLQASKCATSKNPRLGQKTPQSPDYVSGWLYHRMEAWQKARPECNEDLWITSND